MNHRSNRFRLSNRVQQLTCVLTLVQLAQHSTGWAFCMYIRRSHTVPWCMLYEPYNVLGQCGGACAEGRPAVAVAQSLPPQQEALSFKQRREKIDGTSDSDS